MHDLFSELDRPSTLIARRTVAFPRQRSPASPAAPALQRPLDTVAVEAFLVYGFYYRLLGCDDIRRIQKAVAARVKRAHDGLGFSTPEHSFHEQRVGHDDAGELELVAQEVG